MTALEFTWDSRELAVFRGQHVDKAIARALRLAGNQASKMLQQGSIGIARRKKNLPRADIEKDQELKKPRRSAQLRDLAWRLHIQGQPVPVSRFPYMDTRRTSRRGVAVRFGTGGTQRLSGSFEAKMKSGHVGVFRRERKTRLPIAELFSYRLPKDFGGEVMTSMADPVFRKLEASFKRGLDRELGKLKRKGLS